MMSGRDGYIQNAVPMLNLILSQLFLCTSVNIDLELDYEFQECCYDKFYEISSSRESNIQISNIDYK